MLKQNLRYGDAMQIPTARRHLSPAEFPQRVDVASPTEDNGWLGPLGSYGMHANAGSLYGYGVPSDWPQY